MENRITSPGGTPAFAVEGEFTIFSAAALKPEIVAAVRNATGQEVEIDLAQVSEIDSAGLQLMALAKREAVAAGRDLSFVRPSAAVLDVLALCDLASFFDVPASSDNGDPRPAQRDPS